MVTSFSDSDGIGVVVVGVPVVVVVLMLVSLLSIVTEDDVVDVSSSSGGNVGKEIDTLEPFEAVDIDSSSSSSSSKGDLPTTLVPSSVLSTPGVLPPPIPPPLPAPPPRRLRRTTGPRTRMTSEIIELTFASIL